MGKITVSILIGLSFLISAGHTQAAPIAGNSAYITYNSFKSNSSLENAVKRITMRRIFEKYNSPFNSEIESFISVARQYDLPYYLLPSITGNESFFGRYIHPGSYNPFGWNGGYQMFESWYDGIETVGRNLRRNYINKGAHTVDEIGPIYAEDPRWSAKVNHFMNTFQKEEDKIRLFLQANQVEL